jgi:hypothetical protein
MTLGVRAKRLRRRFVSSTRDPYDYAELICSDAEDYALTLIPSTTAPSTPTAATVTTPAATTRTPTSPATTATPNQNANTGKLLPGVSSTTATTTAATTSPSSTALSLPLAWDLLRFPGLILDENEEEKDNEQEEQEKVEDTSYTAATTASTPTNSSTSTSTSAHTFLPETLAETQTLDQMFRLLERLDGRRSRNAISSLNNSDVDNNNDIHISNNARLLPKVSLQSQSFDTADTDVEEEETSTEVTTSSSSTETNKQAQAASTFLLERKKGITWADEQTIQGKRTSTELATLHTWTPLPEQYLRLVILLLHPDELKFEFVHAEYDTDDTRLTVSSVLRQLSGMATNATLKQLKWGALVMRETQQEMITCLTLQEYSLHDGSMLVAVPAGHVPRLVLQQACFFLTDKVLRRVVRRAKLTGRSLQRLQTTTATTTTTNVIKKAPEEEEKNNDNDDENSSSSSSNPASELTTRLDLEECTPNKKSESTAPPPQPPSSPLPLTAAAAAVRWLSFDSSVTTVPPMSMSVQDHDFDDSWDRHATSGIAATTASTSAATSHAELADPVSAGFDSTKAAFDFSRELATTTSHAELADQVPAAFENFFSNDSNNAKAAFDFFQDLVLPPLPPLPPTTATTTSNEELAVQLPTGFENFFSNDNDNTTSFDFSQELALMPSWSTKPAVEVPPPETESTSTPSSKLEAQEATAAVEVRQGDDGSTTPDKGVSNLACTSVTGDAAATTLQDNHDDDSQSAETLTDNTIKNLSAGAEDELTVVLDGSDSSISEGGDWNGGSTRGRLGMGLLLSGMAVASTNS